MDSKKILEKINQYIDSEEFKLQIEEQERRDELFKSNIIDYVINYLNENNKYCISSDEFLYSKSDKEIGEYINILCENVFDYFLKYNIPTFIPKEEYFTYYFCVIKYNNELFILKQLSGQGTVNLFIKVKDEKEINGNLIVNLTDIYEDKDIRYLFKNNEVIYQTVKEELTEIINNFGKDLVMDILSDISSEDKI